MKVQKITKRISPFAGVSFINNEFEKIGMSQLIDNEL
jgi:hypothetical protein